MRRRTLWLTLAAVLILAAALTGAATLYAEAPGYDRVFPVDIQSRIIRNFSPSEPNRTRFGKLEFIGGLELFSDNQHFGGYSGFRFHDGRSGFIGVSDIGFWLTGTVQRRDGKPVGIADARIAPLRDRTGQILTGKTSADVEALELVGEQAILAFERHHRVEIHALDLIGFRGKVTPLGPDFTRRGLRGNKGLEALTKSADTSPLQGALLIFSERSFNKNGDIRAFIVNNGELAEFSVTYTNQFDITDADFLPDGDLIVLERRFNMASGVALRLRRFPIESIKPGARLTGEILMRADMSTQIDNMEGLAVTIDEKGDTILTMLSDDNHSILQRTLLLEFKLAN